MAEYVSVRGVRFEVLGPVDRRRSLVVAGRGRHCCPVCFEGGRPQAGSTYFVTRGGNGWRYLLEHLGRDHFRCKCGWIGVSPGGHVARSKLHGGTPSRGKSYPRSSVRISDL